ncbi:MAG: DUF3108 domain-containing protein [Deltaproteobacteria bacterium]|nr:DUF3108 domain-containing protein [Deltaproteobacteria bacterium]
MTTALAVSLALVAGCATAHTPAPQAATGAPGALPSTPLLGPVAAESARYVITHGVVGELGEVVLQLTPHGPVGQPTTWEGQGHGFASLFGIGESSTFRSRFDVGRGVSTTWSVNRNTGSALILDECQQRTPGEIASHRVHSQKPEDWSTLHSRAPTTDLLGFLLRLRTRPPTAPEAVMVMDGRALWKVTVKPGTADTVQVAQQPHAALRYQLAAEPLDWHLAPSKTRHRQQLTVWLANDRARTPLALEANSTLGNVRIEVDESPRVALR